MRASRLWIEIVIVVVVAVLAFFIGRYFFAAPAGPSGQSPADSEYAAEGSVTRQEVPSGVTVPERGESTPQNIASPEIVIEAAPGAESKKRMFKVSIDGGKFVPDTIIVNAGDIANITFTAVDKPYDIVQPDYAFKLNIAQGESRLLEAQLNVSGQYLFYCGSCGGPETGPKGYLTVVP